MKLHQLYSLVTNLPCPKVETTGRIFSTFTLWAAHNSFSGFHNSDFSIQASLSQNLCTRLSFYKWFPSYTKPAGNDEQ